jgi:hypothetical protein
MGQGALNYQGVKGGLKLNDVIEEFKYVYKDQEIKVGDFVNFINGIGGKANSVNIVLSNSVGTGVMLSAVSLPEDRVFIAHTSGDVTIGSGSSSLYGIVIKINKNDIILGTDTYLGVSVVSSRLVSCLELSDNRVLVVHDSNDLAANGMVVTIDGFNIQISISDTQIAPRGAYTGCELALLTPEKVFIGSDNNTSSHYAYGRILTISSTSFSLGTNTNLSESNKFSGATIALQAVSSTQVIYVHTSDNTNRYMRAKFCSISGTSITVTHKKNLVTTTNSGNNVSLCLLPNNYIFICYAENSSNNCLYGNITYYDSSAFVPGTSFLLNSATWSGVVTRPILYKDNHIFIAHVTDSTSRYTSGMVVKYSGTTVNYIGTDTIMTESYYSCYGTLLVLEDKRLLYVHNKSQENRELSSQFFAIDETNDVVTTNVPEYEQQVTPALEPPFDGIALSSGKGAVDTSKSIIVNGNFSNGVSSWDNIYGSSLMTLSVIKEDNKNVLKVQGTSTSNGNYFIKQHYDYNFDSDIYYCSVFAKGSASNVGTVNMFIGIGGTYSTVRVTPTTTKYTQMTLYGQMKAPTNASNNYLQIILTLYSQNDVWYLRDIVCFNLTEMYGAGKEPTKEWCDENLALAVIGHNEQVKIAVPRLPQPVLKTGDIIPKSWIAVDSTNLSYVAEDGTTISADSDNLEYYEVVRAVDGNEESYFKSKEHTASHTYGSVIIIKFPNPIKILKCIFKCSANSLSNFAYYMVQGSNDNITWDSLTQQVTTPNNTMDPITLDNPNYYSYYKFYVASKGTGTYVVCNEIQTTEYEVLE